MFGDGVKCPKCADAKPNFYRLSADLAGLARVGMFDCSKHPEVCKTQNVPEAG